MEFFAFWAGVFYSGGMGDELTEEQKAMFSRLFDRKIREIYFSPKVRADQKKSFLETLRKMKELWPMLDEMSPEERDNISTLTSLSSSMLTNIADAEVWSRNRRLRNKRYVLWKHTFRDEYLVLFSYFKVSEEIHKQSTIVFPKGLPKPGKPVKSYFYRHAFATKGYREVARGTFFQKFMEVTTVAYTLKSADRTIRFYLVDTTYKSPEVTAYAIL